MKKLLFALSVSFLFTFCSHKTLSVAPAGVSNVTIGTGENKVSADKASEAYGSAEKENGYKASPDTFLNGTWTLTGMLQANGTWSTVEKNEEPAAASEPAATNTDTAMVVSGTPDKTKTVGARRKNAPKKDPLYDAAASRLKLDYKSASNIDKSEPKPYAYWKSTPSFTFVKSTFTGNTGCNSMSGSVTYNGNELRFGKKIATSKMACMDYDESNFLSLLQKADNYSLFSNTLQIRQGTTVLITLKK